MLIFFIDDIILLENIMDKVVIDLLDKIEENSFRAYVVGGYSRDYLLGNKSFDVDICTNALPSDIKNMFNLDTLDTYGGYHFDFGLYKIDITTFRKELKYDKRKPIEYKFVRTIEEDVGRRDFTINAIYMDKNEVVVDPLNGRKDLENKIIRLIGGEEKLKEDPLRMLRAIRFATVLDFEIDSSLYFMIANNKGLIITLSDMRIKEEYTKILSNKNFAKGLNILEKLGINSLLNIEYSDIIYTDNVLGMWAQIKCVNRSFTKEEKSNIIKITEIVNKGTIDEIILYKYGLKIVSIAGQILGIDYNFLQEMNDRLPIKNRNDIDICDEEIRNLTNVKPKIVWSKLEVDILKRKVINQNNELKKYIREIKESD